jgi:hypothetical protein
MCFQAEFKISKPIQLKKEETKLGKFRICKKGIMETIFVFSKTRPPQPKSFLKQLKKHNELIINRIQK